MSSKIKSLGQNRYYYGIWTLRFYDRVKGRKFNKGCPYTIVEVFWPIKERDAESNVMRRKKVCQPIKGGSIQHSRKLWK